MAVLDLDRDKQDIAAKVPGMPANFGQYMISHVNTFAGISASVAKTYRPSDEAIKDSWDNASYMRNDPSVMECVEARQRACALLNWHVEPEDAKDPGQKEAASLLTNLLKKIPRFTQYRENLLHSIWYGKYAVQMAWRAENVRRRTYMLPMKWLPIEGDKIVFSWNKEGRVYDDDRIGIRVGWAHRAGNDLGDGLIVEKYSSPAMHNVEITEQGLAYFLKPRHRPLLALHKHYIEDGPFHTPEYAGRIHGVGVRSRIYWTWFQKQETLAWLMEYVERSAQGVEVWYYPAGNSAAEAATRKAAQERIGTRNIILAPYFPDETSRPPYERIEPQMGGADIMKSIVTDYHQHLIKRYILGQTLTSEAGSTGLGSNLADIHMGTFMQIVRYDAINLEETITQDLLKTLIRYNLPQWSAYDFQFRIDTESDEAKEKIDALRSGWEMGLKIKAETLYDLLGASKPTEKDEVLQNPTFVQMEQQQKAAAQQAAAQQAAADTSTLTAKLASDATAQMISRLTANAQPAAAGTQPEAYAANTPSEDSERVKLRTYSAGDDLRDARKATNTDPSDAQRESGNYAKGKVRLHGMVITLENPKGSVRTGITRAGEKWSTKMKNDYGYIRGTVGKDKDHVDVFLGPNLESEFVTVINQNEPTTGKFDEHKVMLGFTNEDDAVQAYHDNYQAGWKGFSSAVCMTLRQFKAWLESGEQAKPAETEKYWRNTAESVERYEYDPETDPEFDKKHPRANDGKFAPKGSGGYNNGGRDTQKGEPDGKLLEEQSAASTGGLPKGEQSGIPTAPPPGNRDSGNPGSAQTGRLPAGVPASESGDLSGQHRQADRSGEQRVGGQEPSGSGNASDGSGRSGGNAGVGERGGADGRRQYRTRKPGGLGTRLEGREFAIGGAEGYHRNIAALQALRDMRVEGRTSPTPEEKDALTKYVGWGQYPEVFQGYGKRQEEVKALMSDDAYAAASAEANAYENRMKTAKRSTLNAHFTDPDIVRAHWKIAQRLGFKGGRFLEPSAGTGYYLGLMPEELSDKTHTTAIELDKTTGEILGHLYPEAKVHVKGFQETPTPDNFYDLVASNVPFGRYGVHDSRYNKHRASIHDYFFLKSADVAKPGGLITHITSTGTMDKGNDKIRRELAKTCDFVGAIRFPAGSHMKGAGTQVVTDMVILRKRKPGEQPASMDFTPDEAEPKEQGFTGVTTDSLGRIYHWVNGKRVPGDHWLDTADVPDPAGGAPIKVNQYFANNPQMVLGTIGRTGTMYGGKQASVSAVSPAEMTAALGREVGYGERNELVFTDTGESIPAEEVQKIAGPRVEAALNAAIDSLPKDIANTDEVSMTEPQVRPAKEGVKDGAFAMEDGTLYRRERGGMIEVQLPKKGDLFDRVVGQMEIRDAMQAVIEAELRGEDGKEQRDALNTAYDNFVAKWGALHTKENRKAFSSDPDYGPIMSLEKWNGTTMTAEKADMFTKKTIVPEAVYTSADNAEQALVMGLATHAKVDIGYIAKLTGLTPDQVEYDLSETGVAFRDPSAGWQTAAQYLSGNVRQKLIAAREAASADPRFEPNVAALEKNQPLDLDSTDIEFRLGTSWIPETDVAQFAREMVGANWRRADDIDVTYSLGKWRVRVKSGRAAGSMGEVWSAGGVKWNVILEHALNGKALTVYNGTDADGNDVVDTTATAAANDKAKEMAALFHDEWLWEDDERRQRLTDFYNQNMNNVVPMRYDGSHQTFPGKIDGFRLRDMQKNFVWQVVTTGVGCAGHEVGTGKTSSMIAAAMELRRLGLAKKCVITGLKSNLEQMVNEAQMLYPNAKILSLASAKDAKQRNELISRIATNDYDMIFMTHENWGMIPVSSKTKAAFIQKEIDDVLALMHKAAAEGDSPSEPRMKDLQRTEEGLSVKLQAALDDAKKDDALTFEQLGIDQVFVDEAHRFKSLPVRTMDTTLKGIPHGKGSDRAMDMYMKTQHILNNNNGRGVVFATGTPIANTMAELYNLQRYLQPQELESRGLSNFDAWKSTFGITENKLEYTVRGTLENESRFSAFMNMQELRQITSQVIDTQRVENQIEPDGITPTIKRPVRKDKIVSSPENAQTKAMMADIQQRAINLQGKRPEKGQENTVALYTLARKGSVDPRLYDASAPDNPTSKANACVANVLRLLKANPGQTQLIFSDIGVNDTKGGFNLYSDLKAKLIAGGIKAEQIADFSKLKDAEKEEAQERMKRGDILVGIGSTAKLGTGVNVQKNLQAIHHLDVPYVPADIEQRDGRGWRSGNFNTTKQIAIHRYVQEGSFDKLSWQIVARKAGFIRQYFDANNTARVIRDEDTEDLSPEQMMAAAAGDQRLVDKLQLDYDIAGLRKHKDRHTKSQHKMQQTIEANEARHETLGTQAANVLSDYNDMAKSDFALEVGRTTHTDRPAAEEALNAAAEAIDRGRANSWDNRPKYIGKYKGHSLYRTFGGGFRLEGPSGQSYDTGGTLRSLEAVARGLAKKHPELLEEQAKILEDNKRIKGLIGKNFPRHTELQTAIAKLKALEEDLKNNPTPVAMVDAKTTGIDDFENEVFDLSEPKEPAGTNTGTNEPETQKDQETPQKPTSTNNTGIQASPLERHKPTQKDTPATEPEHHAQLRTAVTAILAARAHAKRNPMLTRSKTRLARASDDARALLATAKDHLAAGRTVPKEVHNLFGESLIPTETFRGAESVTVPATESQAIPEKITEPATSAVTKPVTESLSRPLPPYVAEMTALVDKLLATRRLAKKNPMLTRAKTAAKKAVEHESTLKTLAKEAAKDGYGIPEEVTAAVGPVEQYRRVMESILTGPEYYAMPAAPPGFTGDRVDALGRKYHFVNGIRQAIHHPNQPAAPRPSTAPPAPKPQQPHAPRPSTTTPQRPAAQNPVSSGLQHPVSKTPENAGVPKNPVSSGLNPPPPPPRSPIVNKLTKQDKRQMPIVQANQPSTGTHSLEERPALAQKTAALAPEHVDALKKYTYWEHAFPLNDALRNDPTGKSMTPETQAHYAQLTAALADANGLHKPVQAFRGVDERFAAKALAIAEQALQGSRVIEGHGMSSLSLNPAKSVEYAKGETGLMYRIKAKSGAYLEPITRAQGEEELLHGHGKRYYVHGIGEEHFPGPDGKPVKMKVVNMEELY